MNGEDRISDLERRVAALEALLARPSSHANAPVATPSPTSEAPEFISLVVSNKRYAPADHEESVYQDNIWFDLELTLSVDVKATRAIKGALVFADLFGDAQFRIGFTVDEPMVPGGILRKNGIGFAYNQFMSEHQWMLTTQLENMMVSFQPSQAIFQDGTARSF